MKKLTMLTLLAGVFLLAGGAFFGLNLLYAKDQPVVIGRIEKVYVEDAKFTASARIDTGAGVSSINAEIIKIIKSDEADKEETVEFRVLDDDKHIRTMKRKIVGWQNIKKKSTKEGYVLRPVVEMDFCIAGKRVQARVNLADRSQFLYPVLVGRNVLKAGDFLIDPAKTFTHKPACP